MNVRGSPLAISTPRSGSSPSLAPQLWARGGTYCFNSRWRPHDATHDDHASILAALSLKILPFLYFFAAALRRLVLRALICVRSGLPDLTFLCREEVLVRFVFGEVDHACKTARKKSGADWTRKCTPVRRRIFVREDLHTQSPDISRSIPPGELMHAPCARMRAPYCQ